MRALTGITIPNTKMTAQFDRVILVKDEKGEEIVAVIVQDTKAQRKLVLAVKEMSMEELVSLFGGGERKSGGDNTQ